MTRAQTSTVKQLQAGVPWSHPEDFGHLLVLLTKRKAGKWSRNEGTCKHVELQT